MEINWKEVEEFFFKAMLQGWVSGGKPQPIPEFQGFEGFACRKGNFRLLDMWPNRNDGSGLGTTTIFFDNGGPWVAIWRMQYRGKYPKDVFPFLKGILLDAYRKREFWGGRGQEWVKLRELTYVNEVAMDSTFLKFSGAEGIMEGTTIDRGSHTYSGGKLVD